MTPDDLFRVTEPNDDEGVCEACGDSIIVESMLLSYSVDPDDGRVLQNYHCPSCDTIAWNAYAAPTR